MGKQESLRYEALLLNTALMTCHAKTAKQVLTSLLRVYYLRSNSSEMVFGGGACSWDSFLVSTL